MIFHRAPVSKKGFGRGEMLMLHVFKGIRENLYGIPNYFAWSWMDCGPKLNLLLLTNFTAKSSSQNLHLPNPVQKYDAGCHTL